MELACQKISDVHRLLYHNLPDFGVVLGAYAVLDTGGCVETSGKILSFYAVLRNGRCALLPRAGTRL